MRARYTRRNITKRELCYRPKERTDKRRTIKGMVNPGQKNAYSFREGGDDDDDDDIIIVYFPKHVRNNAATK